MIRRIARLAGILIIVALSLYIVMQNRETMTVHLGDGQTFTANSGVVLITTFIFGFLFATFIAAFYGIKGYMRERRLKIKEKERLQFYEGVVLARAAQASGEYVRARELWSRIINKDPTDSIARIELSRIYEQEGDLREALRTIDEARSIASNNIEVLFRAAELNIAINNKTAALDNLALILYNRPNKRAAILARDLSEELDRVEDALEYQKQLDSLGETDEDLRLQVLARLQLKQTVRDNVTGLRESLETFLKRYPDFTPALEMLAEEEAKIGNSDSAAQYLASAARSSGSPTYWQKLSRLWLKERNPQKALAAAKAALRDATGELRLYAELEIIRLLLNVDMIEEAISAVNNFDAIAAAEKIIPNADLKRHWSILKALCHLKRGETKAASELLFKLCDEELGLVTSSSKEVRRKKEEQPAARLSTP